MVWWIGKVGRKNITLALFSHFTLQRAEACLGRAQRLNPMVEIKCDTEPVMKKSSEYFEQFDVVILTGCVQEVMVR